MRKTKLNDATVEVELVGSDEVVAAMNAYIARVGSPEVKAAMSVPFPTVDHAIDKFQEVMKVQRKDVVAAMRKDLRSR